jgi:hypothetical protein
MILISYGTRPEYIKMSPIISKLIENNIQYRTLFTGQHENIVNNTSDFKLSILEYINDYNNSENVQSFILLENKINVGCNLLLHDWSIIEGRGNFIKRYLEDTNNTKFELINIIPGSTGLAHLKKIK